LQAIWREAAAKPEDPVSPETPRSHDVGPAARAIADKSRSYGLRPESKALANKFAPTEPVLLARFAAINARELSGSRFCRRRRSPACRRSGAKRQPNLKIRFPLKLLGRRIDGLRSESKALANKFAPTEVVSFSRFAAINARELSGSRFCRRRRSPACRRSGAKRQPNLKIRFRLTLLGRMINGLRPASKTLANKFAPTGPVSFSRFAAINARPAVASAEGVGALLAGDLARSGSQT